MEALIERCCGLDVHRDTIAACLLTGKADEKPVKAVRTFGTMSHELRELAQWLCDADCTHVAMESTGVYWMAPYRALEEHFELIVGNAKHLAKVPGRKTDVLDSEWIAELLRHGLIRKSFIPPPPIRELRDLTRYRRKLVQSRSSERNRLQKMLEMANIKLASVMSDVFGASGRAILRALVDGAQSPAEMAGLAKGQLRKKSRLLELALDAPFEDHHRDILRIQLQRIEQIDGNIATLEKQIDEKLNPYREQYMRLMQIPGVKKIAASVLIAELGVDMSVFPSAAACASWVGVSPGNNESAGKRRSGRISRGNSHLKPILVEVAQAAARVKGTYLHAKFHKIRSRRGYKRAVVAIAHKILIAAYHMLATGEDYRDLGESYLDNRNQQRLTKRLVGRLESLGYKVTLDVGVSAAPTPPIPAPDAECARAEGSEEFLGKPSGATANPSMRPLEQAPTPTPQAERPAPTVDAHAVEPAAIPSDAAGPSQAKGEADRGDTPSSNAETNTAHSTDPVDARRPQKRSRRRRRVPRGRKRAGPRDPRLPPPGTTLTRIFKGVEYQVLVLDDGFEYAGNLYVSISGAANAITGTNGSGFAFFHLKRPDTAEKDPL